MRKSHQPAPERGPSHRVESHSYDVYTIALEEFLERLGLPAATRIITIRAPWTDGDVEIKCSHQDTP